ncbi:hypothetical protein ACRCUN_23695 [Mycobacterium sp. LTG2003]
MQIALQPSSAQSPGRMNKLVIGGIAALGAGVIAVNPVATSPALLEAQHRAVQLVADVTHSPSEVYGELFAKTGDNFTALVESITANPFPVLSQIMENGIGYADQVGTGVQTGFTQLQTWYETGIADNYELRTSGKTYVANIQAAIETGDFGTAYENFNRLTLFGLMATLQPIYSVILSSTPRGGGAYYTGIIEQIAQNFADAVGAVANSSTLIFGAFQSVFAPLSGAAFEFSRATEAISAALTAGDTEAAFNAIVNTPGVVINGLLNGFDYNDDDTTAAWQGLLTSGGPLGQFLVTIPTKIANAIDNTPATPSLTGGLSLASLLSPAAQSVEAPDVAGAEVVTDETKAGDTSAIEDASTDAVESAAASGAVSTATTTTGADEAEIAPATDTEAPATDTEAADTDADDATTTKPATETKPKPKTLGDRLNAAVKKLGDKVKKPASKSDTSESGAAASSTGASTAAGSEAKNDSGDASPKATGKHAKKESAKQADKSAA